MKLKQKIAISLCAFYLVSVIGVALSLHFCGGKLASVALYANETSCKYCKEIPQAKKDDTCCKNTKVDVKVKDNHQAEASFKLPKLFSFTLFLPNRINEFLSPLFPSFVSKTINKSPPKGSRVAIHVLNCVFRN